MAVFSIFKTNFFSQLFGDIGAKLAQHRDVDKITFTDPEIEKSISGVAEFEASRPTIFFDYLIVPFL